MEKTDKNNFDKRGGELMPRELMERAADPALVPDEALVAVLLKTGVHGLNVIELSRRLIEAFGSMKSLVSGDWRTLEERIKDWNKTHPDRPIKGLGHVKCLELSAAFEMGRRWSRLTPDELRSKAAASSRHLTCPRPLIGRSGWVLFQSLMRSSRVRQSPDTSDFMEPNASMRRRESSMTFSP